MTSLASSPEDILRFLDACAQDGRGRILVTLVGISGTSPRALGAQMAVASDGEYIGSLSGGCIEAAIAKEALAALASASSRLARFGAGSPYIDIRLPCGAGIDLLFTPNPDSAAIADAISRLDSREPVSLEIKDDAVHVVEAKGATGWRHDAFVVTYTPRLRLALFGQGEELTATAQLAHAFGARIDAYSPSPRDIRTLRAKTIKADLLEFRSAEPRLSSDPWTAFVFLFHDRDWEEALIPWALQLPKFYIGALGSRHSHEKRREMLAGSGVSHDAIRSIRSPIGLVPSTRDPATLAASILAEVVQEFAVDSTLPFIRVVEGATSR